MQIIQKLSLELNHGRGDGLSVLEHDSRWANEDLLRTLNEVFATIPDPADYIRIDRIEIELNASSAAGWANEIRPKLKAELLAAISRKLAPGGSLSHKEQRTPEESFLQEFIHFLKLGVLPWSSSIRSSGEWAEAVARWLTVVNAVDSRYDKVAFQSALVEALSAPDSRIRLIHALPFHAWQALMAACFSVPESLWADWGQDAQRLQTRTKKSKKPSARMEARESLLKSLGLCLLETIARHGFVYQERFGIEAVEQLFFLQAQSGQPIWQQLKSLTFTSRAFAEVQKRILLQEAPPKDPSPVDWIENGTAATEETATVELRNEHSASRDRADTHGRRETSGKTAPPTTKDGTEKAEIAGSGANHAQLSIEARQPQPDLAGLPAQPTRPGSLRREPFPGTDRASVYIHNAGMVLLAPFLPAFFGRLEIVKEKQLLDPGMAMAMLHYLATGETQVAEFQLALPKILCGWEIEQPVTLPEEIPDGPRAEARKLLSSLIEHWSVLKNTSPEGLQESFLQRQGRVNLTERDEWLLKVEQKSFDMLLQRLPWSFQMIKLPWMSRLLRTEWVE